MKNLSIIVLLVTFAASTATVSAQSADTSGGIVFRRLPRLDAIIRSAVQNSPLLAREESSVKKTKAEQDRAKKEWMRGVTLEGASQYGSYGDQTVNQLYLGNRVGASVKISLYDLFATGDAVRHLEYQMMETEYNRRALEREVRQQVIERYNAVLLNQRILELAAEGQSATRAHQIMAEKEFTRGEIPLSEYSRVVSLATEASVKYETARMQYALALSLLEESAGAELDSLEAAR